MAKLTGPLLSFGARGAIGSTLVASSWKGIPYARQYVKPANPQTEAQMRVRKTFALLREMWKVAPTQVLNTWNAFALGRPFTGMNKFVGENVRVLQDQLLMDDFIGSPGAAGGFSPLTFTAVAGTDPGEVDWTMTAPAPPAGWTLVSANVSGFMNQLPSDFFTGPYVAMTDAVAPYAGTLEGLTAGQDAVISGWLIWQKPDGNLAYSVSTNVVTTTGA